LPGKAAPGVTDIWVIFKTHCDLGYTMSADAVNVPSWEARVTVTLPAGIRAAKATPVTLRGERTGEPVSVRNGRFDLNLGSFAPASFILE